MNLHKSDPVLHQRALRAAANLKENTGPSVFTRAREQGEPLILGMADGSQRKARVTSEADYDVELDDGLHRKIEILYAIPTTSAKNLKKVLKRDPKVEALDLRPAEKAKDRPWISKMILQQIIDEGSRARFTLTDGAMIPVRVRSFGLYEINGDIKGKSITIFDMACTVSMLAGRSWLVLIRGSDQLAVSGTRFGDGRFGAGEMEEQERPTDRDADICHVEHRPVVEVDEVYDVASRQAVGDVAKSTGDDEGEGTVDEPPGFPLAIPHEQEEADHEGVGPDDERMFDLVRHPSKDAEAYISVLGVVEVEHTRYDGDRRLATELLLGRVFRGVITADESTDQEQENDEGSQFHGGLSQRETPSGCLSIPQSTRTQERPRRLVWFQSAIDRAVGSPVCTISTSTMSLRLPFQMATKVCRPGRAFQW